MRIRLVSQKHNKKKPMKKKEVTNKLDIKEELGIENIERVPKELFQILGGETLSFIESINNMEEDKDEDK